MSNQSVQVATQLASKGLRPTSEWLSSFLSSQKNNPPLQSLLQTAQFRLYASDITTTFARDACFPGDLVNPQIKEQKLSGIIPVQVLGVEDISKSRWEQVEAIEAIERGESKKGREIIRVAAIGDAQDQGGSGHVQTGGIHKLLLQDAAGNRAFGLELRSVEGVGLGMNIGCKLLLREAVVARGVILLESKTVTVLGGKIDAFHKAWREGRKAELIRGIEEQGC